MKIVKKEVLAEVADTRILKLEVRAPDIAKAAQAGQFVVLMVKEVGERFPLTVVDKDPLTGTITLIVQEIGLTTKLLGKLKEKESLFALAGPLGHPSEIKDYGNVILLGGGVGIAEVYPVAKALKSAGNKITTILGARTKELLILKDELKSISERIYITTDDGSLGEKGVVIQPLQKALEERSYDFIYTVGPIVMMREVSKLTKEYNIKTTCSLNALMVDATGMCGSCRVSVDGQIKFACVDGPDFDAHKLDWNEIAKRSKIYLDKENHICRLSEL